MNRPVVKQPFRSSNLELPSAKEVLEMIHKVESPRVAAHRDLIQKYLQNGSFDAIRELQMLAGTDDMFNIDRQVDTEESFEQAITELHSITDALVGALTSNQYDADLLTVVYDELSHQDEPKVSDIIFVFGAPSNSRVEKAAELYKKGFASNITIAGRGPHWNKTASTTEAGRMAARARELGVLAKDILVESKSVSVPDNVKRTIDLLDKGQIKPKSIIIVTSAFGLLRAAIDWQKFTKGNISILRVAPAIVDPNLGPELWYTNDVGRKVVINEYAKIINEAIIDELIASKYGQSMKAK